MLETSELSWAKHCMERGEWQDNGYPCTDAMTYFRLYKCETMGWCFWWACGSECTTMKWNLRRWKQTFPDLCGDHCSWRLHTPPLTSQKTTRRPKKKRSRKRSSIPNSQALSVVNAKWEAILWEHALQEHGMKQVCQMTPTERTRTSQFVHTCPRAPNGTGYFWGQWFIVTTGEMVSSRVLRSV